MLERFRRWIDKNKPAEQTWESVRQAFAQFAKSMLDDAILALTAGTPIAQLRAQVLEAFAKFYDEVIAPIDLPDVPNFVERSVVDPVVKLLLLQYVAGVFDSLAGIITKLPRSAQSLMMWTMSREMAANGAKV
jgi:hypothetical protein